MNGSLCLKVADFGATMQPLSRWPPARLASTGVRRELAQTPRHPLQPLCTLDAQGRR